MQCNHKPGRTRDTEAVVKTGGNRGAKRRHGLKPLVSLAWRSPLPTDNVLAGGELSGRFWVVSLTKIGHLILPLRERLACEHNASLVSVLCQSMACR